jgi:hypothetical protein
VSKRAIQNSRPHKAAPFLAGHLVKSNGFVNPEQVPSAQAPDSVSRISRGIFSQIKNATSERISPMVTSKIVVVIYGLPVLAIQRFDIEGEIRPARRLGILSLDAPLSLVLPFAMPIKALKQGN